MASPSARSPSPCSPSASPLYHDDDSSSSSTRSSCSTSSCSSVTSQPLCEPDVVYLPPSFTHASSSLSLSKTNVTAGHMVIERALQKGNHGHVFLAHWQLSCSTASKCSVSGMKRPRCTTSHSREYCGDEEDGAGRRSGSPCAAVHEGVDETRSTRRRRRRLEGSEGCDGTGAAFVCYEEVRDGGLTPPRNMCSDCSSEKCGSLRLALKIVSARSAHVAREVACLRYLQQQHHYAECAHTPSDKSMNEFSVSTNALPCPRLYFALPESSQAMALMTPSAGLRRALHRLRRRQPYFIAVELLGPDLFDFTGRYWLTEQELCLVAAHMLTTLRAVHRAGVVHRSVKPENFCWALPTRSSSTSEEVATTALRLKLIDYGRSTFPSSSSTSEVSHAECDVERPYTGWWHSLHGFIGRRLGPKDDLMGIVHTVGYLLDDFRRDTTRSSDKHTHHHRSKYHGKHYAACRRVLSDRILDAYAAFYAAEEQSHTITECNTITNSDSDSDVSSHYFARAIERPSAAALAYMETRVLPRLLPDTYYPAHLPAWWKAWYGECGAMHAATGVTPEQMAQRMHHVLMQRVSGQGSGEGVHVVQSDVAWLVQRYLAKHATSPSPR